MDDEAYGEREGQGEPRSGRWATGGAVAAAVLASTCCILPLVLGAAGLSSVALAGAFESARPLMLVVTAILLGVGFYYNYLRKPDCELGEACETPRPRLQRFNRGMLWLATVAVVVLALFPSYATVFTAGDTPPIQNYEVMASRQLVLEVSGMTCEACAVTIQNELAAVPGVLRSDVDYDGGMATVLVRADTPPSTSELLSAVGRAGYSAAMARPEVGEEG